MKKIIDFFLLFVLVCPFVAACDDDDDTDPEWVGWQERNDAYFIAKMDTARQAIAQAQAEYGDDWEDYCTWRVYKDLALAAETVGDYDDSICVEVINRGTGSGCPIYTDSVRVNYRGMLIPNELSSTTAYQNGYVFAYTGISSEYEDVFDSVTAMPVLMYVGSLTAGLCTAVQYMHIGDLWRIYIPAALGYGSSASGYVPAWSTLIFEIELKAYYSAGTAAPEWRSVSVGM